jgi:hypothetical protein
MLEYFIKTIASQRQVVSAMVVSGLVRRALFLSPLWPEPGSSAAGVRTEGLLRAFQRWGWDVHYAAANKPNAYTKLLSDSGVPVHECGPNRADLLASILDATRPSIVVFDRFMAEEAYSFRVRELAPDALRVLDMQDLHALRKGRQELVESGADAHDVLMHKPSASSESLLRELGAIQRSDLTLVCSPVELELLRKTYGVAPSKLCLASFFCQEAARDTASGYGAPAPRLDAGGTESPAADATEGVDAQSVGASSTNSDTLASPRTSVEQDSAGSGASLVVGFGYGPSHGFEARNGFVIIGGFRHAPNVDAVEWLAEEIWPRIRARLPRSHRNVATMRVYGAYTNHRVQALHNPSQGFFICGHAKNLDVLARARVLLAPVRYGAGIKGKIVDAWRYGLPVVATKIGAEGMRGTAPRELPTQQPRQKWSAAGALPTSADASDATSWSGEDGLGAAGAGFGRPVRSNPAVDDLLDIYGEDGLDSGYDVEGVVGGRGATGAPRTGRGGETVQLEWGGLISSNPDAFASNALTLYFEQEVWDAARLRARSLLRELYSADENLDTIRIAIEEAVEHLPKRREADFAGALLWQQSARSTEYFSRWIELKEAAKGKVPRSGL